MSIYPTILWVGTAFCRTFRFWDIYLMHSWRLEFISAGRKKLEILLNIPTIKHVCVYLNLPILSCGWQTLFQNYSKSAQQLYNSGFSTNPVLSISPHFRWQACLWCLRYQFCHHRPAQWPNDWPGNRQQIHYTMHWSQLCVTINRLLIEIYHLMHCEHHQ